MSRSENKLKNFKTKQMTAVQSLLNTIEQASYEALEMEREQRINTIIAFQLFLSEHNYISDHLWDFEDLAIKFLNHEEQ